MTPQQAKRGCLASQALSLVGLVEHLRAHHDVKLFSKVERETVCVLFICCVQRTSFARGTAILKCCCLLCDITAEDTWCKTLEPAHVARERASWMYSFTSSSSISLFALSPSTYERSTSEPWPRCTSHKYLQESHTAPHALQPCLSCQAVLSSTAVERARAPKLPMRPKLSISQWIGAAVKAKFRQ